MVHLAIIFHMHQPYYRDLLTQEASMPWVRLHGTKDYLDMVKVLQNYPNTKLTFNLVPSLLEQIEDYIQGNIKDTYFELSLKPAATLSEEEKRFIYDNFFSINLEKVISTHPRYYELFLKKKAHKPFTTQDFLDLQVWFNLAWIDPLLRFSAPHIRDIEGKGRRYTEEEKHVVLHEHIQILKEIIPAYRDFQSKGQIELTCNPFYHPILPLLDNIQTAKEANPNTALPAFDFKYPEDAKAQINEAIAFHNDRFGSSPCGMWPSEEAVSEHILPLFMKANIKWIIADESIVFKSLKKAERDTALLYQPHRLKRKNGELAIIFRDRNLSDLIGFEYNKWRAQDAVHDFFTHIKNIADHFKGKDVLVTIAMDGENAWEHYRKDGHEFFYYFYEELQHCKYAITTTVREYLEKHPPTHDIKHLSAGSWIYADFGKWIGNPYKVKAWEYLAQARTLWEEIVRNTKDLGSNEKLKLAKKQIYICEGSDWFWWYGDDHGTFDPLFRTHLANFYRLIDKPIPDYLNRPLQP